ncbi:MAG: precorrin-6y C5,15-methyltransferase (decarboxylating) subunit CbiE [Thermodesulfobacteriota bacterium]|nr:precorrin-6y C5,15-methyltransferase (decarboxylating) subunit CbiE [Thermodesulfobacteriota bacterium]
MKEEKQKGTIYVLGVGPEGLSPAGEKCLHRASMVFGTKRFSSMVPEDKLFRPVMPVERLLENLNACLSGPGDVVVLASGDPLFFGIGRMLLRELSAKRLCFIPSVSSIQLACSELKIPWDDLISLSFHGRKFGIIEKLFPYLKSQDRTKIALLTDPVNTPRKIAQALLDAEMEGLTVHVAEDLGGSSQTTGSYSLEQASSRDFHPLNVVVLTGKIKWATGGFGRRKDAYQHSGGLITKAEVRSVVLGALEIPSKGVMWDIGACSGSVSIEAAGLAPGLRIIAVEKNKERIEDIKANIRRYQTLNIDLIKGNAPEVLEGLSEPDRVFIGGGGIALSSILKKVVRRLKGRGPVVATAITLESLMLLSDKFAMDGFRIEVSQVQVSRLRPLGQGRILSAHNPVFVIKAWR